MQRLIVKNFGPITEADITLRKINIFIGEQGIGKSTMAKLFVIMNDYTFWSTIGRIKSLDDLNSFFISYNINTYFKENTSIYFEKKSEREIDTKLIIEYSNREFKIEFIKQGIQLPSSKQEESIFELTKSSFEKRGMTIDEVLQKTKTKEMGVQELFSVLCSLRSAFYVPAERAFASTFSGSLANFFVNKIPIPAFLIEFISYFEKAKHFYPSFEIPFLSLTYNQSKDEETIKLDEETTIPFKESSSGIQSVIPLLMAMNYASKEEHFELFAVEEPENNLFPENQVHLLRELIKLVNENESSNHLIVTTHSPYLLSAINILLTAGNLAEDSTIKEQVDAIIPPSFQLCTEDVSVYSLGCRINEGPYCKDLIMPETGMVGLNYLDSVSQIMTGEFQQLKKILINKARKTK